MSTIGNNYGGYMKKKQCKYCGDEFTPTHHYQTLCSDECRAETSKLSKRKYQLENYEKLNLAKLESNRICMANYRKNNFLQYKLKTAKHSAKRRGLEFNLTVEDIQIPELCPLLNIPLVQGGDASSNLVSIDRIDSSKGYIKGNVQVISCKANTMKSNATKEELITFAKNILALYGEL